MFNTSDVVVEQPKEYVSKYITPGITDASIVSLEEYVTPQDKKGLRFSFMRMTEDGVEQTSEATRWMDDSKLGASKTLADLVQIAEALGKRNELDEAAKASNSVSELASNVFKIIGNQRLRFKFSGKEVAGKDGKSNWFKSELSFYGFVESLAIPETESKLKFDTNNSYDMKKLSVTASAGVETAPSTTGW